MDNLLIYLVQSYNREALDMLVEKYRKVVKIWTNDYLLKTGQSYAFDQEYINNEMEFILYQTIENYEQSKGVFYSYLKGAVYNSMMNYVRYQKKSKNNIVSLNSVMDNECILQDSIVSYDNLSFVKERYEALEEIEKLMEKIKDFNKDDQKILLLKMQGFTNEEIQDMTATNIRKVNYIFRKIRKL